MTIRVAVLTVSDRSSRGERADASGPAVIEEIQKLGWDLSAYQIVPDERQAITAALLTWSDEDKMDVILTSGGTGFATRDVTPEATLAVVERLAPGLAEAMRQESLRLTPHAMLSRAVAGIRGRTIIINLPGSPKAARENLAVIVPVISHAVQLLRDDPAAEGGHRPS